MTAGPIPLRRRGLMFVLSSPSGDLEQSFPIVRAILAAERSRRERNNGLADFVNGLLKEADDALRKRR